MRKCCSIAFALTFVLANTATARTLSAEPSDSFESDRAYRYYETGTAKFDAEDYAGALEDLDRALELERNVYTLYANAQALNNLDRCEEAVPLYKEILANVPADSDAASAVKEALVLCADKLANKPTDATPDEGAGEFDPEPEPAPKRSSERAWYKDVPAPVLLGVGLVGVGVGGAFLGQAAALDPEAADDYGIFEEEREEKRALWIRGGVVTGIGGALVVGGVIRYIVVARKIRSEGRAAVVPSLGPSWAGLSVRGRF